MRNPEFGRFRQTKRVRRCAPSIRKSQSDSASEPLKDTAIVFANRPGKLLDPHWLFQGQLFVQRPGPANPYAIRREVFDLGASHPKRQLTRLKSARMIRSCTIGNRNSEFDASYPTCWGQVFRLVHAAGQEPGNSRAIGEPQKLLELFSFSVGQGAAVVRDNSRRVNFAAGDPRSDGAAIPQEPGAQ